MARFTSIISVEDYVYGIQYAFNSYYITYSLIKSVVFAYLISSISAFYGYFVKGGALEVGKASTNAVVSCSVLILFADMILTQLLMQ